jgi:hypothetical protein
MPIRRMTAWDWTLATLVNETTSASPWSPNPVASARRAASVA